MKFEFIFSERKIIKIVMEFAVEEEEFRIFSLENRSKIIDTTMINHTLEFLF